MGVAKQQSVQCTSPLVCALLARAGFDNHHAVVKNVVHTGFVVCISGTCTYIIHLTGVTRNKKKYFNFSVYFLADCYVRSFELTVLLKVLINITYMCM